jgi:hypothetical protein
MPHGSRNLHDLVSFSANQNSITGKALMFHDQECLNYDFYNLQDFEDISKKIKRYWLPEYNSMFQPHADKFHHMLKNMHLRAKLIYPILNKNDQVLLCHSEKNSRELERYEQNNFIGVYYWSHALIARDWFRYAELDPALTVDFDQITKDFLIYNRAWSGTREYRLTFAEMLLNQNLHRVCHINFNKIDSGNCYVDHKFANTELSIDRKDIENYLDSNDVDASASADYNNKDYVQCAIEVVLETLFDDQRQHLTEKALRPIACGRPFILAATPNSLQYLRDYGFETFDGLINESYDMINDPRERLFAIVEEMQRISSLAPDLKQKLWQQLYEISARNKQLFFSDHWHDCIVSEFKNNFESAIKRVTSTEKYWNYLKKSVAEDDLNYHDYLIFDPDNLIQFNPMRS